MFKLPEGFFFFLQKKICVDAYKGYRISGSECNPDHIYWSGRFINDIMTVVSGQIDHHYDDGQIYLNDPCIRICFIMLVIILLFFRFRPRRGVFLTLILN